MRNKYIVKKWSKPCGGLSEHLDILFGVVAPIDLSSNLTSKNPVKSNLGQRTILNSSQPQKKNIIGVSNII